MKFEIELNEVKPKTSKQKWILGEFLRQANENVKDNSMVNAMRILGKYNDYAMTLTGKYKHRVDIPNFKPFCKHDTLSNKASGTILKAYNKLFEVKRKHSPSQYDKGQWVGVEIECVIPNEMEYDDDGDEIEIDDRDSYTRTQLVRMIQNSRIKYVTIKSDGSIDTKGQGTPVEFTILTKIGDMTNLKRLCDLLKNLGATVNYTCGLHIHLDQRDVINNKKELGARLMRLNQALPLLTSLVPQSRRNNTFCRTDRSKMRNKDRYMAINTRSLRKFSTFEIRLHSGTTDFLKISNWIKLCYGISRCDKIKNSTKHVLNTIEQVKANYLKDLSFELVSYFLGRADKFKTEKNDSSRESQVEANDYESDNVSQTNIPF